MRYEIIVDFLLSSFVFVVLMLSVNVVHVNTKHHLRSVGFEPWWEGRFVLQL
jgi:hypothetical protein